MLPPPETTVNDYSKNLNLIMLQQKRRNPLQQMPVVEGPPHQLKVNGVFGEKENYYEMGERMEHYQYASQNAAHLSLMVPPSPTASVRQGYLTNPNQNALSPATPSSPFPQIIHAKTPPRHLTKSSA